MKDLFKLIEYEDIPMPKNYDNPIMKKPQKIYTKPNYDFNKIINEANYNLKTKFHDDLLIYLILSNLGFVNRYGEEINELFYKIVNNTKFVFEKGNFIKICNDNGIKLNDKYLGIYTNVNNQDVIAVSREIANIDCFNTLIHEIRHAITSINNSNYYLNPDEYYIRSGLCEQLRINNDLYVFGNVLDEVFNIYYTELMTQEILKLNNVKIENHALKQLLKTFKVYIKGGYYFVNTYETARCITYPLFYNGELVKIADNVAINGNIMLLKKYFYNLGYELNEYGILLEEFFMNNNLNNIPKIKEITRVLGGYNNAL